MASERKPLIAPGSVLPSIDTLSRILERDRQRSGRNPLPKPEDPPLAAGTPVPASAPAGQGEAKDAHITSNITAHTESNTDARPRRTRKGQTDTSQKSLVEAQGYAHHLASTRAIPITLRLPEGLNDWLDEYAHTHRKQGVRKQDLIARAVALLVVALSAEDAEPV